MSAYNDHALGVAMHIHKRPKSASKQIDLVVMFTWDVSGVNDTTKAAADENSLQAKTCLNVYIPTKNVPKGGAQRRTRIVEADFAKIRLGSLRLFRMIAFSVARLTFMSKDNLRD